MFILSVISKICWYTYRVLDHSCVLELILLSDLSVEIPSITVRTGST
jgi:hypothetical protein